MRYYPEVDPNPDFAKIEEEILTFWQKEKLFHASVKQRPAMREGENNEFIFYDGPPFANGLPHYGHLLTGFVKDAIARYQTMRGHRVERRFGWDCHGLPAEMGSEKELNISGRQAIQKFGIDKFNEHCRTSVMKYTREWEHYVTRQARWVDFKNDYKTMDTEFMESVLWAFKQLYDKGLIYEAHRVMPYSWAAETPLSNFETKLDNSYREREDKAITVAFELNTPPKGAPKADKYYVLAWTTTPWTLPSNLALAVNKEIEYVYISSLRAERSNPELDRHVANAPRDDENVCYILSAKSLRNYLKTFDLPDGSFTRSGQLIHLGANKFPYFTGDHLIGLSYTPLFPYFKNHKHAFKILDGSDFVTDADGTGIVHMAPGFGEDDQRVCEKNGIELVVPVDEKGRFTEEIFDIPNLSLKGLNVIAEPGGSKFGLANDRIIEYLKGTSHFIKQEQILHNYPHCWRTDTPLIYRALPSWYVEVTKFRERAAELNQDINWIPEHVRDGQMGHMLATAPDWSISRNRFWGTPIPIWKSNNPASKELYVFGSIEELEDFFKVKVTDLHRPYIDQLTAPDPQDARYTLTRVADVFDCWFESGSMPFAQVHYPFENKEWFEKHFPADFITEYVGQTRGWFNTLIMLSTALFDKPPFLNCICHGVVLDAETGLKYSKRLKNYRDPLEVIHQFGADALRWLMLASPVMRGQDLMVDPDGKFIRDVVRLAIKPIWNAYNFFCLYANADKVEANLLYEMTGKFDRWRTLHHPMDRYILSKLSKCVMNIAADLDAYNTPAACEEINAFFEALNNWYIRRSKPRFWKEKHDDDKQDAYDTLYTCLHMMSRAIAPLLPMVAEEIYLGLTAKGIRKADASVHLADFPNTPKIASIYDPQILTDMERVRDICNAALAIRNARNLRVRLPLASLTVVAQEYCYPDEFADIIKDEVNIKEVKASTAFDDSAQLKLQVNFPKIGARLGAKTKEVIPAIKQGKWSRKGNAIEVAGVTLADGEFELLLEPKSEIADSAQALASNDALVVLDTNITPELEQEGLARDVVRLIQQARKEANLDVSDKIALYLEMPQPVAKAVKAHQDYIMEQTLADSLVHGMSDTSHTFRTEQQIEEHKLVIALSRAA